MKKTILTMIAIILLTSINLYAAPGDVNVEGKLNVGRDIKIGNTVTACDSDTLGSIKSDGTDLYACLNGEWQRIRLQLDSNTSLHLKGDGADGSTAIIDSSDTGHTVEGHGTSNQPEIDTAQSQFGGASILFDDSDNQYLSISDHPDFDLSTGNWTISFWVRFDDLADTGEFGDELIIFSQRSSYSQYMEFHVRRSTTVTGEPSATFDTATFALAVMNSGGYIMIGPPQLIEDTWYHVEIVYDSSRYYTYVDGTLSVSNALTFTVDYSEDLLIGAGRNNYEGDFEKYFSGWIDDFRILKGVAVRTE